MVASLLPIMRSGKKCTIPMMMPKNEKRSKSFILFCSAKALAMVIGVFNPFKDLSSKVDTSP
jgi:hypothetical protein